jgi:hypothetical protein
MQQYSIWVNRDEDFRLSQVFLSVAGQQERFFFLEMTVTWSESPGLVN